MRAVLLVEGESDRNAVRTIAGRRGHDLDGDGISVLAMGGATNIARHLDRFGPRGRDLSLAGLYDRAEERFFLRAVELAGIGPVDSAEALADLGFFVCDRDLEDEMIRAVGVDGVLGVVEADGEIDAFRVLQNQPAHRGARTRDQLHRFIGSRSGRKIRYGRLLAEAVPLDRVPPPLDRVLAHLHRSTP